MHVHPGRRRVKPPAQHLSSCQGDLHPLPELWSETSLGMERRMELRLAGKHKRWLPNPVLSRTRPQCFSGESWQRRIEKWARVFHCVTVCLQLRLLTFAMSSNQLSLISPVSSKGPVCVIQEYVLYTIHALNMYYNLNHIKISVWSP